MPESWLLIWVLLCGSGLSLSLWAPLLQMDKIISRVTDDCDSMHLPWNGGLSSQGPPITLPCFLGATRPQVGQGAGSWLCPLPLLDPQALPQICRCPVHCLHMTDKWLPCGRVGTLPGSSASTQLHFCHPMFWGFQAEGSRLAWSTGLAFATPPLP